MSAVLERQVKGSELKGRVEDPRLLTGRGRYVDDLKMEGQAYMGIVRSPFAHAKIKRIDLSKAQSSPDFIAALTGQDLVKQGVSPVMQNQWPPQKHAERYHLAVGKVRFMGEPVAAVLVKRKSSVEDLLEMVEVDYEPLPVVTTIEESKKGTTLIYDDWGNNVSQSGDEGWGNSEKAIASAPYVVRAKEGIARQESVPMEPRSTLVRYQKDRDVYEVYATVQSVHGLRERLASELRMPEKRFHVKVMDMGGGFGSKGAQSYPEPLLACLFSRMTGVPVAWTATRTEEFLESATGRDQYCDITMACDREGKIVAIKADLESDIGVTGTQNHMSMLAMWTIMGHYKIPNVELHMVAYATNKMPIGPVRGAGAPEGCYFIERTMNLMAEKMGMDPLELRRRNLQAGKPEEKDQLALIDELVTRSGYRELLKWRDGVNSRYKQQGPLHSNLMAGLGVSFGGRSGFGGDEEQGEGWGTEGTNQGGSGEWPSQGDSGQWRQEDQDSRGWSSNDEGGGSATWGEPTNGDDGIRLDFEAEYARATLDRSGNVKVYTGSSPHGQGIETTFAQLASEELNVPIDRVSVIWGDSVLVPAGIGTFGSRSAVTGGSAVVDACRKVKSQLVAASGGRLSDASTRGPGVPTIAEVLDKQGLVEFSAESTYKVKGMSYSSGVHVCALTLDAELGKAQIVRYVVVEDCGRIINKQVVEGQLQGGVIHAIGGVLLEKLEYDGQGNLLNSTFMDYCIPTALDSPGVEVFLEATPSKETLNGAKGVGESGTIVGYAAVMNALNDALSAARPGAHVNFAPATPNSIIAAIEGD